MLWSTQERCQRNPTPHRAIDSVSAHDPTGRFSDRVADYVRARPGYPPAILEVLEHRCSFTTQAVVADVGSGTGLLAKLFLDHGNTVFGIEPNPEMRAAGEQLFGGRSRFKSVAGGAEDTTLPAASVDLVTAGQAFHWFDRTLARREFARILKPGGWVVLVWNDRRLDATPFLRGYEALLVRHCPEYLEVVHRNVDSAALRDFYSPMGFEETVLDNRQRFDWDGLVARHLSSSFVPRTGHEAGMIELRALFDACAVDGFVEFEYDTRVQSGQLS
jgi:SAM-dependent methyltransferase